MKKLYRSLLLLSVVALACGMWSCSDDNDQPGTDEGAPVLGVEAPASDAVFATSATFSLSTKGAESYVYKVVEGENATEPDPIIVYAQAREKGTIVEVTGEKDEALVAGLEGNKTYTVFFIFKVGDEYKTFSQSFTTAKYTQRVTIIKTDMFSVTFHVEVPEDEYYAVSFTNIESYMGMKDYGHTDVDYSLAGFGMNQPRFKGPRNITIQNGAYSYEGALNEDEYSDMVDELLYSVNPGTGYVLFVTQCAEDGTTDEYAEFIDNGGGDIDGDMGILGSQLPNIKDYTEERPKSENVNFLGNYSKTILFTEAPKKGTGHVATKVERLTEKSATISFTPSDDVLKYVVALVDDEDMDMFLKYIGGEDGLQVSVLNGGEIYDAPQQITYPLVAGHTYTAFVVGVYNEDATIETLDKLEGIKTMVSKEPAVEFEVTPLTLENPYQIGFNIKAPNKDCASFKYLLNYTKDWFLTLNGMEGETLEDNIAVMMSNYGQLVNDAEVMNQINSEEGYDIVFSSMDDTESWLIVESYNIDEKTKLFYDGPNYKTTSASIIPEEPVNSDLFSKLQGTWTATITSANNVTVTCPVTIKDSPEIVETLPEDVKNTLTNYFVEQGKSKEEAESLVLKYFEEYKERADYYTKKYKNMNCLVATGFTYDEWFAPLATSWDLFCSTEYSSYNTDELFRDYGPKMFLKIGKDENGSDVVSVITTRMDGYNYSRYVDPLADWYRTLVLCAYNINTPDQFYRTDYPVEISDDKNTITIKSVEQEGEIYTPSFAIENYGFPSWNFATNKEGIVLTRTDAASAKTRSISKVTPKVSAHSGNHFRRTRTPYEFTPKTSVCGKVFSVDSMKKNLKK